MSFWFIPKLISLSGRGDALLALSMEATAMVLALPSPPRVAGHPFSSLQEAGTTGGTWATAPLCMVFDCPDCKAEKPKAGGGRDLQQEKVALLGELVEGVFIIELPIFSGYLLYLFCCELSCCLLLLPFTTTWLQDVILTPSCFGFAPDLLIILSEGY